MYNLYVPTFLHNVENSGHYLKFYFDHLKLFSVLTLPIRKIPIFTNNSEKSNYSCSYTSHYLEDDWVNDLDLIYC